MQARCSICGAGTDSPELCAPCANLLRWVRGYFAHVPELPSKITPETRFVEELGADSLDWMYWPLEAEEKLGVVLSDWQLERALTVGQFIRVLRDAGAEWPNGSDVRLIPRLRWWSPYRWEVVESVEGRTSGGEAA
jgi:acyl carrier protein